jgi:hypothetical protein
MKRLFELYSDGRLYEYEGDQIVKVTEALKFSTATTFRIAPPTQ